VFSVLTLDRWSTLATGSVSPPGKRLGAGTARRYTCTMKSLRATLLGLACALPALSFAQWQWIDKDGHKVFSDQSPPAEVPAKNILRRPGSKGAPAQAAEEAAAVSQAAKPAPSVPRVSGKDKDLQEKKRQAEAAEAEKKKAGEEEVAKARAENCARAKRSKATFDSGIRVSTTNDKGEREFMDEASRGAEAKRLDGIIASDCKAAGG
jgi:type IV secretory pathway VirB10-like protein